MTEFKTGDRVKFARHPRNAFDVEVERKGFFYNGTYGGFAEDATIDDVMSHEFVLGEVAAQHINDRANGEWVAFDVDMIGPFEWGWVRTDDLVKVSE